MRATASTAEACERVTGYRPPSCPWRGYADPLVRAVVSDQWALEVGAASTVLSDDTPAVLVDAHAIWRRALESTWADERARAEERLKAEAAAREMRRGRG